MRNKRTIQRYFDALYFSVNFKVKSPVLTSFDHLIRPLRGGLAKRQTICFAALRLMTNSNFVACCTGKSAGLAPFKILST